MDVGLPTTSKDRRRIISVKEKRSTRKFGTYTLELAMNNLSEVIRLPQIKSNNFSASELPQIKNKARTYSKPVEARSTFCFISQLFNDPQEQYNQMVD